MQTHIVRRAGQLLLILILVLPGCKKTSTEPAPVPELPVRPPDPTPPPAILTSVADILAGNAQREVLMAGTLVSVFNASDHQYRFSDPGSPNEITVDFSSDHVPTIGQLVLIWGKVQSDFVIDVIEWSPIAIVPTDPVTPPVTPPDPTTPPFLATTKIGTILAGGTFGSEVIIAGTVTRQNGTDDDEWFVQDNTGEIVVDFSSDHVPGVGTAVYVWGKVSSSEIDEIAWCPQASC